MGEQVRGYCNRCEAEREIYWTVDWQENACVKCGSSDVEIRDKGQSQSTNHK